MLPFPAPSLSLSLLCGPPGSFSLFAVLGTKNCSNCPVVWSDLHPKSYEFFSQGTCGQPSLCSPSRLPKAENHAQCLDRSLCSVTLSAQPASQWAVPSDLLSKFTWQKCVDSFRQHSKPRSWSLIHTVGVEYYAIFPFVSSFQCWARSDTSSSTCKFITPPVFKAQSQRFDGERGWSHI